MRSRSKARRRACAAAFPIPMRGNEYTPNVPGTEYNTGFPIPMRGNENFRGGAPHAGQCVGSQSP